MERAQNDFWYARSDWDSGRSIGWSVGHSNKLIGVQCTRLFWESVEFVALLVHNPNLKWIACLLPIQFFESNRKTIYAYILLFERPFVVSMHESVFLCFVQWTKREKRIRSTITSIMKINHRIKYSFSVLFSAIFVLKCNKILFYFFFTC